MRAAEQPTVVAFTRDDIERTIPARFEDVVQECPDRLALTGAGRTWTYSDLNCHANRIAHAIRQHAGDGPGRIAYLLPQSPEMIVATLAVLKAGKTYVAVHPRLPLAAQADILRDVEPELLLTSRDLASAAFSLGTCPVLAIDDVDDRYPSTDIPLNTRPTDVSTLFYTSGSTGQPKGVFKSHRAVLHRVWLSTELDRIAIDDRQSLLTHCSFSASEADMFGALLQGAAVCTFDIGSHGFSEFGAWLESERITLLHPPVLFFRRFLGTLGSDQQFPHVRAVALAGDVVLATDLQRWKRHFPPPCVVLHRFSITETALLSVARIDHASVSPEPLVDAGVQVPDKELTIVDSTGQPVPRGEVGELIVKSAYLAGGYWRRDDETNAVFSADPQVQGRQMFRTGDLGRFLPDGRFVFLGRQDYQVKVRGYRVDVREIEAALLQVEGVREAACVPWKDHDVQRLRAVIVWYPGARQTPSAIRMRLREHLPEWKIPTEFQSVSALPTTLTDKIDRRRLSSEAPSTPPDQEFEPENSNGELWVGVVEETVSRIFTRVLRLKPIARDADFFDLGGDSLLLTELQMELESRFGPGLALRDLLRETTVRGVARAVERLESFTGAARTDRSLVPLRRGRGQPLFIVHGGGGLPPSSRHVLDALGQHHAVWGFRARGFDANQPPRHEIPIMAADYIATMRGMQPNGPYLLSSFCGGGVIAIEMARQLTAAGEQVAPLVLIDPSPPPQSQSTLIYALKLATLFLLLPLGRFAIVRTIPRRTIGTRAAYSAAAMRVWTWFRIATYRHRPNPYDGAAQIIGSRSTIADVRAGCWKPFLTGPLTLHEVGTTHRDVFAQANEEALAVLEQSVETARAWCEGVRRRSRGLAPV